MNISTNYIEYFVCKPVITEHFDGMSFWRQVEKINISETQLTETWAISQSKHWITRA